MARPTRATQPTRSVRTTTLQALEAGGGNSTSNSCNTGSSGKTGESGLRSAPALAGAVPFPRGSSVPDDAVRLLDRARDGLASAAMASDAADRYAAAHLAALRAAAAVLAARARPVQPGRAGRPRTAWALLGLVAPELGEWAAFFAAGAAKRAAAEAGLHGAVTDRESDDVLRDAATFLALVETTLGLPHQPALPPVVVALRAG
jgi:hypothetical protein